MSMVALPGRIFDMKKYTWLNALVDIVMTLIAGGFWLIYVHIRRSKLMRIGQWKITVYLRTSRLRR